ncbi:bromodomain-containing protein 8-like [Oncorhynchus nerka]|uniref:bromodomain-containing protein 8-like n=1 Tax=Oncorhynchus nerka TaxID=8023 RepID=UPI0031B7F7D4
MASGVGKHKLLAMGPTEPWSVREKLCLATSVMKSGDQNWVSVSRAIKPFADAGRPPDWFSQKHCASQYSELLETTETPKRKRGEKGEVVETAEDVIVRRLTAERIEELKRLIRDTQEKHRKLKKEAELIQAGHLDSKLEELRGEIVQKKKQEEEEADVKRKAIDTAYLARQAVKNTPKRVASVTVRSPPGCGSPSLEFCQGDIPQSTPEDPSTSVTTPEAAGFMPLTEACGMVGAESGLGTLLDDSPQKKLLGQKATPPPSPLLSELLKKGSFIPTSPRLVGDGDLPGNMTIAHDLQLTGSILPGCLATGAPTLSRLLEAGPQFSAPLGSLASSTDSSSALLTAAAPPHYGLPRLTTHRSLPFPPSAFIQGDENAEALDAAAVEAALSLCEETPCLAPPGSPGPSSLLSLTLPPPHGPHKPPPTPPPSTAVWSGLSPSCSSMMLEHSQPIGARLQHGVMCGANGEGSPVSPHATIKCESEEWMQQGADTPHADSEGGSMTRGHSKEEEEGERRRGETKEDSYSLHTASSLQLHTTADSIPSSPASSKFSMCIEDQEARQALEESHHAGMASSRQSQAHGPVGHSDHLLRPRPMDLLDTLTISVLLRPRPMDLSTIKKSIETGLIRTTAEFQRDIMLMFQNTVMYNSCDHDVFHMALEMQRDVLEQIQQFLATQLIMQTSESGISVKSLRGQESTRKQDPSDKDGGTRGRHCAIEADLKMKMKKLVAGSTCG